MSVRPTNIRMYDAWILAALHRGDVAPDKLAAVSDRFRPLAERMAASPLEGRGVIFMAALRDFGDESDAIEDAIDAASQDEPREDAAWGIRVVCDWSDVVVVDVGDLKFDVESLAPLDFLTSTMWDGSDWIAKPTRGTPERSRRLTVFASALAAATRHPMWVNSAFSWPSHVVERRDGKEEFYFKLERGGITFKVKVVGESDYAVARRTPLVLPAPAPPVGHGDAPPF